MKKGGGRCQGKRGREYREGEGARFVGGGDGLVPIPAQIPGEELITMDSS